MPYLRKLPSGKWQATVRHPSGRRITRTDPLRRVVDAWARELEAQLARGDLRDPRAGRISVAEWYGRWAVARHIDPVTRRKIESIWRTHCEPQWAHWPMDAVTRLEAQEWVRTLTSRELAAATVREIVHVMSSLYRAATSEHPPIVIDNPFAKLELPRIAPRTVDFYERDEVEAILAAMRRLRPREPQWALLVEVCAWVGLRMGEAFGLHGDRVDWLRGRIQVTRVVTRAGLREYPKTRKSHRIVPVPPERGILEGMSVLMSGRSREAPVFVSSGGGLIDDSRFRHRVWLPALREAGVRIFPPRILRHTAASWLVMDGVPLYDVQALLGHESFATTQRYAHLAPDAHERILDAWARRSSRIRITERHG